MGVRQAEQLLLCYFAQCFESGRRSSEAEVNAVLCALRDGHAALRRYFADEDFLSREDDSCQRGGGTRSGSAYVPERPGWLAIRGL